EINERTVEIIGRAYTEHTKARKVAIACDKRRSSPSLFKSLIKGLTESGAEVIDLGLLSTPMLYFASSKLDVDGAIMVTASHNPGQYNGLKFCKKNAVPIGLASGLAEIRDIALAGNFPTVTDIGRVQTRDIKDTYMTYIASFADFHGKTLRIATDAAHAMGVLELPILQDLKGLSLVRSLYGTLESPGTCPHEANPFKTETLNELGTVVREFNADLGIAYDGDADRVGFVDEHGAPIPMDFVTALLAEELLKKNPGATILYDLRSSESIRERIESLGGVARECMVGHANIKRQMVAEGALFAGELTGHYYFSLAGYSAEMGTLPAILLMNLITESGKKLSKLVTDVRKYYHSGEISLHAKDISGLLKKIRERYANGKLSELDGIKISFPGWWFSLRASNTEPLIRLNLEAHTRKLMEEKREELLGLIKRE
ncbi:MAG: phosphomannomutase/phosphoglucomutase, partial [Patescibacteria group bacterium]